VRANLHRMGYSRDGACLQTAHQPEISCSDAQGYLKAGFISSLAQGFLVRLSGFVTGTINVLGQRFSVTDLTLPVRVRCCGCPGLLCRLCASCVRLH
jgi:hypothetical protein